MTEDVCLKEDKRIHRYRLIKTAVLFFSWICLGLYNEVVGPTLPDLKERSGSNYEEISRVLSGRSAGLFIGSIVGGAVHDRWVRRRDLILAVALLVSAATIAVAPWCSSLGVLGIVFHLMGQSHGLLTTGANPTLAIMWAERSAGPFNFMHAGFGLGGTIGPLISRPFMSSFRNITETMNADITMSLDSNSTDGTRRFLAQFNTTPAVLFAGTSSFQFNTTSSFSTQFHSRIEIPYGIVGVLCSVMSLAFLIFFIIRLPARFTPKETPWREIINPRTCAQGQTVFGIKMLVLIFLYYMFVVGGERAFGKFVFSYAIDSRLSLTKEQASWLTAAYWICYTAARLLTFFASTYISIHVLIFILTSGTLVSAIFLNIFPESRPAFWLFSMTFGFCKSPLFPSCLGWANHYIDLNSMTIMCVNIGSSTGGMLVQWLTGYLFEYYGPISFLYLIVAYSAGIFFLFILMHRLASRHGDKYSRPTPAIPMTPSATKIFPVDEDGAKERASR